MIYLTGDTHGEFGRFAKKKIRRNLPEIGVNDYVIVCGDFGLCWSKGKEFDYYCDIFTRKPYSILWVQGNHENYDMIAEYPLEEWHGGKVRHIVKNKVILLERGQVFEIEGKRFFTFGGASSHDVQGGIFEPDDPDFKNKLKKAASRGLPFRINHISWWSQELPTVSEMNEGLDNLAKYDCKVDYVITHCCTTSIQQKLGSDCQTEYMADVLTDYLERIEGKLQYKHWYFGHYHMDMAVDDKHTLLYRAIIPLCGQADLSEVHIPGRPRYQKGDLVRFCWGSDRNESTGEVRIVDAYGIFGKNDEPFYDIFVNDGKTRCLFKHVRESDVLGVE